LIEVDSYESDVSLFLQGKTNAYALSSQTFGDGIFAEPVLPIDSTGEFSDTIYIAFAAGGEDDSKEFAWDKIGFMMSACDDVALFRMDGISAAEKKIEG
jgi:hypothetical protein